MIENPKIVIEHIKTVAELLNRNINQ